MLSLFVTSQRDNDSSMTVDSADTTTPPLYTTRLGPLECAKNNLAFEMRRRMFATFTQVVAPGPEDRVADFGVSGHRDHPVHQFFELLYPHPERLTAIGQASEGASWYEQTFPGVKYLEADLRSIPLPDNYFDAGLCNAVVEHAGTRKEQAALVHEVCRVSRAVVFTTPNRSFPIELHTFVPFGHWMPIPTFHSLLRVLGNHALASVTALNPLNATELLALFPTDRETHLLNRGPLLLQSNLMCASFAPIANQTTSVRREHAINPQGVFTRGIEP